ncbi:MAG: Crp/Fnr family transcriptional regulator [Gammaproteobacteria bacterium]|nr:Crp/Fnr family transcriptional regulator [Gammaproteobacteria bacterium]
MTNIREYLESHEFFSGISASGLDFLAANAQARQWARGEALFVQEDVAKHFYVVITGEVSVQIPALYGPPLIVQNLGEGAVLGWSWLIEPFRWAFEAHTKADSEIIQFDGRAILARCEADHEFGYALFKRFARLMSKRLEAARLKMMDSWAAPGTA